MRLTQTQSRILHALSRRNSSPKGLNTINGGLNQDRAREVLGQLVSLELVREGYEEMFSITDAGWAALSAAEPDKAAMAPVRSYTNYSTPANSLVAPRMACTRDTGPSYPSRSFASA